MKKKNSLGRNPFQESDASQSSSHEKAGKADHEKDSQSQKSANEDWEFLKIWKNHPLKDKKIEKLEDVLQHRDEIAQYTVETLLTLAKKVKRDYLDPVEGFTPQPLRDLLKKIDRL